MKIRYLKYLISISPQEKGLVMEGLEWFWKVLLIGGLSLPIFLLFILRLSSGGKRKGKSIEYISRDQCGLLKRYSNTSFYVLAAYGDGPLTAKERKAKAKKRDLAPADHLPILVVDFEAGMKADGYRAFASLVDEIAINSSKIHEVVVKISSSGGMAHLYGYLYSQMVRLRESCDNLTVALDTTAASGGMWMSLPAKKIIAAPSSFVGSLGAITFKPNVYHMLDRLGIKVEAIAAGEDKFSSNPFANPDAKNDSEFTSEFLKSLQTTMLESVKKYRGEQANIEKLSSARIWTAENSIKEGLGLIDELMTSDEYLLIANRDRDLIEIGFSTGSKMQNLVSKILNSTFEKFVVSKL